MTTGRVLSELLGFCVWLFGRLDELLLGIGARGCDVVDVCCRAVNATRVVMHVVFYKLET